MISAIGMSLVVGFVYSLIAGLPLTLLLRRLAGEEVGYINAVVSFYPAIFVTSLTGLLITGAGSARFAIVPSVFLAGLTMSLLLRHDVPVRYGFLVSVIMLVFVAAIICTIGLLVWLAEAV